MWFQSPPLRLAWTVVWSLLIVYALAVMMFLVWYGPPFRIPAAMASIGPIMVGAGHVKVLRDRWQALREWRKQRRNA